MKHSAYRIVKRRFASHAFDGEGARRFGGRWNSPGVAMVYTAGSQSLAMLEMLVHLDTPELLGRYFVYTLEFPQSVVERLEEDTLPRRWNRTPAPSALQNIGDAWIQENRSAVLRVPSALVPSEQNYLLNPSHPDMRRVKIEPARQLRWDRRLLK